MVQVKNCLQSFCAITYFAGIGTVVASADSNDPLLNKRVFLVPMRGWEQDPEAPESTSVCLPCPADQLICSILLAFQSLGVGVLFPSERLLNTSRLNESKLSCPQVTSMTSMLRHGH